MMLRTLAAALACFALSFGAAHAAPFATTYVGSIGASGIPGAPADTSYSLTFIMDNGGTSASGQAWSAGNLTCAILRSNGIGGIPGRLAVDMTAARVADVTHQIETDAQGSLRLMFRRISIGPIQQDQYSAMGLDVQPGPLHLWANALDAHVLRDGDGGASHPYRFISDADGGLNMHPGGWSSPFAVGGPCDDTPTSPLPAPPHAPFSLHANPGDGQVLLTWTPPVDGPPPTSYTAYVLGQGSAYYCTAEHPSTRCVIENLQNGLPHTFAVTASAPRSRPSGPSNQVTATPTAGQPPVPAVDDVRLQPGDGQVTVHWTVPTGAPVPDSYTARVHPSGPSCTVAHPAAQCTVTGLVNGQSYLFYVRALVGDLESADAGGLSATPQAADPGGNPGPGVQPVPALGVPALLVLGASAAGLGLQRLSRRRSARTRGTR